MFFVYGRDQCSSRGEHVVHEDEDGLFRGQLDPLADDIDKLSDCEVGRYEVFLLVDVRDIALVRLLDDYLRNACRSRQPRPRVGC